MKSDQLPVKNYANLRDPELWNRVKVDDKKAFETIFLRYWSSLLIYAYNILKDKAVCQDILQDIFADLWNKRRTTFIDNLSGYLKVSTRNRIYRHLRDGAISQKHLDTMGRITFVEATEQMVNFNLMKERYEAAVEQLPAKCKEVFLLSRMDNLSNKQIAGKLNISIKAVEKHITKALNHLRTIMGDTAVLIILPLLC